MDGQILSMKFATYGKAGRRSGNPAEEGREGKNAGEPAFCAKKQVS